MFVDCHAHLCDAKYGGELDSVIERYRANGVGMVVNSGYDLPSSIASARLAEQYADMYFTAGVHPDEADTFDDDVANSLIDLSKRDKFLAIGEIGFDFYHENSSVSCQERAFVEQMKIAGQLGKPFVLHSRNAPSKTLEFLKANKNMLKNGFLAHCFSESVEIAEEFLKLGAFFSFGGVITFKNAKKEAVVSKIPFDRILTETDCPYLSPEPFRGTVNEPSRIPLVAAKIAEFKGADVAETEKILENNAKRFYGL